MPHKSTGGFSHVLAKTMLGIRWLHKVTHTESRHKAAAANINSAEHLYQRPAASGWSKTAL